MHGNWESKTANPAPLGNMFSTSSGNTILNCGEYWLNQGVPRSKFVLGIPTFGRSFVLKNASNHQNGDLTITPFPKSLQSSYAYYEICKKLESGWSSGYNDNGYFDGPYAFSGNTWIGYENINSVFYKSVLAWNEDFLGIMFWSLDTDDFSGACGDGNFPLIKSASQVFLQP